jgi:hypothetical protein
MGSGNAIAETPTGGQPSAIGTAMTVADIRRCLCAKSAIEIARTSLQTRRDELLARESELAALENQIRQLRATMSPSDSVSQQILKGLIQQQISLRGLLQSTLRPELNAGVKDLGEEVAAYNEECTTRVQFEADMIAAKRDLVCPVR